MKTSQPEKILKLILPSLQMQHADLGIVLSRTAFRLSFVKRTVGELHYKLDQISSDTPSVEMPTEKIIRSDLLKISLTNDVDEVYSLLSEFLCKSIPEWVVMNEGLRHKCDASMTMANIYVLEHKESENE